MRCENNHEWCVCEVFEGGSYHLCVSGLMKAMKTSISRVGTLAKNNSCTSKTICLVPMGNKHRRLKKKLSLEFCLFYYISLCWHILFAIPAASYPHNSFKANLPGEVPPKRPLKTIWQYCVGCLEEWEVEDTTTREPWYTR